MGSLITFNGIEDIGKQFYSKVAYNHVLKIFPEKEDMIKKFSFPNATTTRGTRAVSAIKQFKEKDLDLDILTTYSKLRYRKVIQGLLANYWEYQKYVDLHLTQKENVAIINNYYYSLITHGLATLLEYIEIQAMIEEECPALLTDKTSTLSFILVTPQPHKIIKNNYHLNHYKQVNNNYKQLYLALAHSKAFEHVTPVYIEIDFDSISHISDTCKIIKERISKFLA